MKKLFALLLLITVLALSACGNTGGGDSTTPVPEGMQVVTEGDGYTFFAPEDWSVDLSTGVPTAYVSAIDPSNITLVRERTDASPAEYFEASLPTLTATFSEFTLLDEVTSDNTTLGGRPAIVRAYSGKLLGTPYTVKQYIARVGEYLYLFTYTAKNEIPSGDVTYYARYEEKADAAAAALLFSGTADTPADTAPPTVNGDGLVLISDPAVSRYSLFAPATWTPDLRGATTSATREGAVLLLSYEIPKEDTIEDYWSTKHTDYASLLTDYDLVEEECTEPVSSPEEVEVWLGGVQAVRRVFTFSRGGITYKCLKLLTVKGIYVYTLTYTATLDAYNAYAADLDAVISAFEFK